MALQFPSKFKILARDQTRKKGLLIEGLVAEYLRQHQFSVITRNFQCRLGEIDLILKQEAQEVSENNGNVCNECLVFVEVRFRKNMLYGGPLASINWKKQQKLIKTAEFFLKQKPYYRKYACRFDVVGVTMNNGLAEFEWVQNAFQCF